MNIDQHEHDQKGGEGSVMRDGGGGEGEGGGGTSESVGGCRTKEAV